MTGLSTNWAHDGETRGRPDGRSRLLESIVRISRRQDLEPSLLVAGLIEAITSKVCHCGPIDILCREHKRDSVIFLLTKGEKVVSQFPIHLELLKDPAFLKNRAQEMSNSCYPKTTSFEKNRRISELRFGMKGISVSAKITEIPPRSLVTSKLGYQSYVSNATIADETGTVRLSLWNTQIDAVHVKDKIKVENCYVSAFAGELQLRIHRGGTISVVQDGTPSSISVTPETRQTLGIGGNEESGSQN